MPARPLNVDMSALYELEHRLTVRAAFCAVVEAVVAGWESDTVHGAEVKPLHALAGDHDAMPQVLADLLGLPVGSSYADGVEAVRRR